ncbi:hypothetical protein PLESTM_001383100 [Pleodorina starrii]|nr:hypothetical protein PLESTM_001383100 [Pleodorina starrii]
MQRRDSHTALGDFMTTAVVSTLRKRTRARSTIAEDEVSLASRLISRTTMKPSVMLAGPVTIDHNLDTIQLWYVTGFILPQVAVGLMDGLCSSYSDGKVFDSVIKMYLNKSPMAELLWPLYPAACQSWPLVMLLPVPKTKFLSDVTFRCFTCTSLNLLLWEEAAAVMFMVALDELHRAATQRPASASAAASAGRERKFYFTLTP